MYKFFFAPLIFSVNLCFPQQNYQGFIHSKSEPIPYAKVLINNSQAILTDTNGKFTFNTDEASITLKITVVGHTPIDTVIHLNSGVIKIEMEPNILADPVVVTGTMREMTVSKSPVKIEVINHLFFKLNPVNNVVEAVNLVNGVQEVVACGVCGTNDIHINGMEGSYTLVLIDGMPIVSGLSTVYGLNGIPESMIDRVEIIKGPASTLYGTEAVGGVVNVITKKNATLPLLEINTNATSHQEYRASLGFSPIISKKITTALGVDYYYNQLRIDKNNDNFTDFTLNNRLSVFNKWTIINADHEEVLSIAGRYFSEDRFGGVMNWTPEYLGSDSIYGENIKTKRWEVFGTYHFPIKKTSLKLDFSANQHIQDSYYGNVNFSGRQQIFFTNLIWQEKLGLRHFITGGLTNRYQMYEDNTPSNTNDDAYIPALFVQDEYAISENLELLTGLRVDHHQKHGIIFSPRVNLKKNFGDYSTIRLNYGTGFRQVYLFTEDHAFISGSRDVVLAEELDPERSHNLTINFNQTYAIWGYGNFDVDVFYTYFTNKIIPDYDQDPNLIVYENLNGYGITRGVSMGMNHTFKFPLSLRIGVTIMDVFEKSVNSEGNTVKDPQLFAPKFSGTFGLSYNWKKQLTQFSISGKLNGPMHLPTYEAPFERPEMSPWFALVNLQITKTFKKSGFECYGGIKNVFNYTQPSPLISPENPFNDNFDTSYAYGPLQTRRFFIGIRWKLNRKENKT